MSETMKRLDEITAELKAMDDSLTDVERGHARADLLLVEALRLTWNQDLFSSTQLEGLLSAYADVPKWYS